MTLLNHVPDHDWFFCFPLSTGVLFITILGIIHPLCWIKVINAYRSVLFLFIYVLIGFWAVLSCGLLYAIFAEASCLYMFWIWYTMAFGAAMVALMVVLIMGFWTLDQKKKAILAVVGFIYYLVTLYFVVVVNRQRKIVFGPQDGNCGDGDCSSIPSTVTNTPEAPTHATRLVHPTSSEQPTTEKPTTTTPAPTTAPTSAPTTSPTTSPTTAPTTAPTTTTVGSQKPRLRTPLMRAVLDADKHEQTTRAWVVDPVRRDMHEIYPEEPQTFRSVELGRVARLAELLINSNECRTPHKPAHGQYTVRRRRSTLRLKLRCESGYRENSVTTKCKHNWWDRPIPQCRKIRPPGPLPNPGGGCIMPVYPDNGVYTVADHSGARPGDVVSGDNVILMVTCDEPYRAVDSYVICVGGRWRHGPPTCLKHCKLGFDPTVEYKCLKAYKDKFLSCEAWQPDGTTVAATCRSGHAHRGPFRYMRCRGHAWDHEVSCVPNANFTR